MREADNTQMLKQKNKEAENTLLHILFFAPVFLQCNVPIYCCIPCLPTLVFFSVMLLNFVFFGIWFRRLYQTSIQPHNVYLAKRLPKLGQMVHQILRLDAQTDDQNGQMLKQKKREPDNTQMLKQKKKLKILFCRSRFCSCFLFSVMLLFTAASFVFLHLSSSV